MKYTKQVLMLKYPAWGTTMNTVGHNYERYVPFTERQRGIAILLGWHRSNLPKGNPRKPYWWKPFDERWNLKEYPDITCGIHRDIDENILYTYDIASVFEFEGVPNPDPRSNHNVKSVIPASSFTPDLPDR